MARKEQEGKEMERGGGRERERTRGRVGGSRGEKERERARDPYKVHLVKQVPVFHAADDHIGKQVLNVVNTLTRFVNSG